MTLPSLPARRRLLLACAAAAFLAAGPGRLVRADGLSLERIMADPDWMGAAPESPRWSSDGASILFDRKIAGCEERDLISLSLPDGAERVIPDDGRAAMRPWSGTRSPDGSLHAFVRGGDIHLESLALGTLRQLTRTADSESEPRFMADGARLAYRRGNTWLFCDLGSGLESPAADLRAEDDPRKPAEHALLRDQQQRLFDTLRLERARGDDAARRDLERRAADPSLAPAPFYLGKDSTVHDAELSPAGRWMLVTLGGKGHADWPKGILATHVTESGDTETRPVRPKVGSGTFESQRLVLLDLVSREQHVIALDGLPGITEDPLAALRALAKQREQARPKAAGDAAAEAAKKADEKKKDSAPAKKEPRPSRITRVEWNDAGTRVAVQVMSTDNKDRWIAEVDLETKKLVPLHRLHDPAWVSWDFNDMGWLPPGDALWYLSEESGWSNVYLRRTGDRQARQLTFGRQCVTSPVPTRDGRFLYFVANPRNPGIFEVHRVEVATGRAEQVSHLGGLNSFVLSPDESQLLITHSTALTPPELVLADSAPGGLARTLTHSTSALFDSIAWTAPRFVDIPSRHGVAPIRTRVYLPSGPAASNAGKRSAVIFIHGAGYLQDAHEGWSSYFREFMFASLLTREGHVVIDPDYRASAGYGRAWRTAIHRNMGGPELDDLSDCIEWLATEHDVDRSRVGAWGGSYGGFLVLMAMFKRPEMLACGAALRPVTDWSHYNHGYTSNILETPELAPEAYRRSSPIEWASGLSRPLLMCAPMLDDNVLFQDTVRLTQRLIELEKPTFEVAIYPVEPHGFRQPSSWLDEYRRIHALLTRELSP